MIVVDTSGLLLLLDPSAKAPVDPNTKLAVSDVQSRVQFYISELHAKREKVLIPTPVLSELLILAGDAGPAYYDKLSKSVAFEIAPFDDRAAIELAIMTGSAMKKGDKRSGSTESMAKIKFDRQIIAIGRVRGAHCLFADDENARNFAKNNGMNVIGSWELPLPPKDRQVTIWEHLRDDEEPKEEE